MVFYFLGGMLLSFLLLWPKIRASKKRAELVEVLLEVEKANKFNRYTEKLKSKISVGRFHMRRLIWLLENSKWVGTRSNGDIYEDEYKSFKDYKEDLDDDIKGAASWIENFKE